MIAALEGCNYAQCFSEISANMLMVNKCNVYHVILLCYIDNSMSEILEKIKF